MASSCCRRLRTVLTCRPRWAAVWARLRPSSRWVRRVCSRRPWGSWRRMAPSVASKTGRRRSRGAVATTQAVGSSSSQEAEPRGFSTLSAASRASRWAAGRSGGRWGLERPRRVSLAGATAVRAARRPSSCSRGRGLCQASSTTSERKPVRKGRPRALKNSSPARRRASWKTRNSSCCSRPVRLRAQGSRTSTTARATGSPVKPKARRRAGLSSGFHGSSSSSRSRPPRTSRSWSITPTRSGRLTASRRRAKSSEARARPSAPASGASAASTAWVRPAARTGSEQAQPPGASPSHSRSVGWCSAAHSSAGSKAPAPAVSWPQGAKQATARPLSSASRATRPRSPECSSASSSACCTASAGGAGRRAVTAQRTASSAVPWGTAKTATPASRQARRRASGTAGMTAPSWRPSARARPPSAAAKARCRSGWRPIHKPVVRAREPGSRPWASSGNSTTRTPRTRRERPASPPSRFSLRPGCSSSSPKVMSISTPNSPNSV
ncbi:hypothetical protein Mterra_01406 [Calidithermus terrae]|uniref:Uncharacterized protein n=1 Tax=Calidithermus terrae TaxID=1408545 RepID=A0A399ETT6_9DEIN|nr:hypothetical protein Mterra_01406 [Calidithermus terrae]